MHTAPGQYTPLLICDYNDAYPTTSTQYDTCGMANNVTSLYKRIVRGFERVVRRDSMQPTAVSQHSTRAVTQLYAVSPQISLQCFRHPHVHVLASVYARFKLGTFTKISMFLLIPCVNGLTFAAVDRANTPRLVLAVLSYRFVKGGGFQ